MRTNTPNGQNPKLSFTPFKQENFLADLAFSEQKWNVQGKCFGNLISPKFVLTISTCILEEREAPVYDKIVKDLIEEARVLQVHNFS